MRLDGAHAPFLETFTLLAGTWGDCGVFFMGGGSPQTVTPKNPEWKYPPPNFSSESILKQVCSD